MNKIIIILTVLFAIGWLILSIKADEKRDEYWQLQKQICGVIGYYYSSELMECVPAEGYNKIAN